MAEEEDIGKKRLADATEKLRKEEEEFTFARSEEGKQVRELERNTSKLADARKKIADDEEDKAARIRYLKRSKENAEKFVESVIVGDPYASIEDLKEALDYKAFIRVDPYMRRTGAKMERQIFDDKDTD